MKRIYSIKKLLDFDLYIYIYIYKQILFAFVTLGCDGIVLIAWTRENRDVFKFAAILVNAYNYNIFLPYS